MWSLPLLSLTHEAAEVPPNQSLALSLKWCFQGMCFSPWLPHTHSSRYPGLPDPHAWEQGWGCAPRVEGSSILHADGLGFGSPRQMPPDDVF